MNTIRVGLLLVPILAAIACFPGPEALAQEDATASEEKPDPQLREQTIYVPYEQLRDVFEKEGRGVFLPYEQFQELWQSARSGRPAVKQNGTDEAQKPDPIISQITSEATIRNDVVRVEATLQIELLRRGWNTVPLRLGDAAIQNASIDGRAARITTADGGGYQLLVEHREEQPTTIELNLVYVRAFSKSPGQNSVSFAAPRAPVNRWRIRVPGSGVKVSVAPMIAATQDQNDAEGNEPVNGNADEASDEETVLLAFVGSAEEVSIRWTAKSEGASGMTALVTAQADQEVFVSEGAVRTRTQLSYAISRSQIESLEIEVPADQKVVNVFDANVRKWDVKSEDDVQVISVELFEPASSSQSLRIELEQFIDESMMGEITAPLIRVLGVSRQQGTLVLQADPSLKTEPSLREGLLQVDASELPASMSKRNWELSYRYASTPYNLVIAVEKIQPLIQVKQLVELFVKPEEIATETFAVYDIQQAGIFELELDLPSEDTIVEVIGRAAAGVEAASVDSFRIDDTEPGKLLVDLKRKASGKIGLVVRSRRSISDPNLLSPTGDASSIALPIPEADQPYRNQYSGHVIVYSPPSLRLDPTSTTGLRNASFNEALSSAPSIRDGRFSETRPTLAFAFSDQATNLQLDVQRRSPYVTARQMQVVRVDSGVVKFDVSIFYEILYSGVNSLRVNVPETIAEEVRNLSGSLRDLKLDPTPEETPEGYVVWEFSGDSDLIGAQRIQLTWEQPIDELSVGSSVDFSVPRIIPANVDRAWGQIVVTKTETLDVQPSEEPTGLRPIDPVQDLMPDARVPDAAAAMEFYNDWSLSLRVTRYQLEELKRTSIERALVRTVVTRSERRSVAALYRIRSARQRLSVKLPPGSEFDSQPARVRGEPVALERGEGDLLFIPLVGLDPKQEFLLELRYTVPGSHRRIDLPEFPDDPAIQKVYLSVFLPTESVLLKSSGPWTEEFQWSQKTPFRWTPVPASTDDSLEKWVREGLPGGTGPTFQTDGTMYLYSALHPAPPPDGELSLMVVNDKLLSALVVVIVGAIGLLMLRRPGTHKLVAVVALLIAAVLVGVFAPTFGRQLLAAPTYGGLLIVGLVWGTRTLSLQGKRVSNALQRQSGAADKVSGETNHRTESDESARGDAGGQAESESTDDPEGDEENRSKEDSHE